ncbi:hypothetical protein [Cumulibacter manganitolerans]|uniref:hypothetical protein n=1 Tax=Cumulibacter manganitolerans TaxID=1884992 RepID=UPI0012963F3C|nr:hypothetical protein [Cumulibacter manganitolerans]
MSSPAPFSPTRIGWLDGRGLRAADLAEQCEREALTRRLHTGVVHDSWGVALGLGVALTEAGRAAVVAPGLAYDRLGREIVCSAAVELATPAVRGDGEPRLLDLVARWASVTELRAGRDPQSRCVGGAAPEAERPLLRWVDAGDRPVAAGPAQRPGYGTAVRLGIDVPLGRVTLRRDGTLGELDLSSRRTARGRVRPHIAAHTVRQGAVEAAGDFRTWRITVDTTAGGFTSSSATTYVAALGAHPWGADSGFNSEVRDGRQSPRELLRALLPLGHGPFLQISGATRTSFQLTVRHGLPARHRLPAQLARRQGIAAHTNPVPVLWAGVEWVGGCEPSSSTEFALIAQLILLDPQVHLILGEPQ